MREPAGRKKGGEYRGKFGTMLTQSRGGRRLLRLAIRNVEGRTAVYEKKRGETSAVIGLSKEKKKNGGDKNPLRDTREA